MKVCLMTFNAKYIHKALALRWLYVARDKNYDTEIVEYTIKDDLRRCLQDMLSRKPDVIACSTYIWNVEMMKEWVVLLKEAMPQVRIILGGPEVSFECEPWLDYPIEAVLRGEGEMTLWQAIRQEKNIDGYFSKERISPNPFAKVNLAYLETLESPYFLDFDLADMDKRYFYFETSRGCPYRCAYCLSSTDNQVRFFSKEYLFQQLKKLEEIRVKQVKLLDRTFNASDEFSWQFVQFIERLNCDASFQFEVVADKLSERMLQFLMHEATVSKYRFEIGIQSFHLPTLQAVHRTQDLERCKEVIRLLTNRGFALHVDLIGGLPYEDLKQFEQSFNELFSTQAKEIQVGILKLLKGTALRNVAKSYAMQYIDEAPYTVEETAWLSKADLSSIEALYHATEKFYNSGRCAEALKIFHALKIVDSPFSILMQCGHQLKNRKNIQVVDYYRILFEIVANESNIKIVQAILLNDYMMQFKQKPMRCFLWPMDEDLTKKIRTESIEKGLLHEQVVYNYTNLEWGWYRDEIAVQLLIYSKNQTLPQRLWFNKEGRIYDEKRNLDCDRKCA